MLIARLQSPAFAAERTILADALLYGRARFVARLLRADGSAAHPTRARELLADFADLAFEAVRTDYYRSLQSWCRMHVDDPRDGSAAAALLRRACATMEAECAAALPIFSPLLGDIRFALRRMTRAIVASADARDAHAEDAIDIALDENLMHLDAHDEALGLRARMTADWAGRIAEAAGLDARAVEFAQRGAMLADVGKRATPRHILQNDRPRSIAENIVYEQHAIAGWEMLSRLPTLAAFAPIARHHHERVDGGGYPDGLAGAAIPRAARIVALADALVGAFPEPSRGLLDARSTLARVLPESGGAYDPALCAALEDLLARAEGRRTASE